MGSIRNKHVVLWGSVAVWALLFTAGSAFDWYYEPARPLNEDIFYQNYNVDAGPRVLGQEEDANKDVVDTEMNRAMLLYKIMQSLKLSRGVAGQYYRPNSGAIDYIDFDQNAPMTIDRKMVAKRITKPTQRGDTNNAKSNEQPQTQSTPTKVKATRIPTMCYLKLCSFRTTF